MAVDKEGVDVVEDSREPEAFHEAGIDDAPAVVVTVDDDTTAIFTTLEVRDLNPDIDVVVRANEPESEARLHRAGADYVQSLATVSGRMMASTLFEDETVLAFDTQLDVVRVPVGELAGRTLADAAVRSVTGCTVVAVVRSGETFLEIDPDSFEFEPDDEVVIVGTDESVHQFERTFPRGE